jgi:hypothetical protein
MPAKMKITREQQAIEIGVDPAIYQAQMEGM